MLVRDFIKKHPDDNLQMMTPGGFVYLTLEQSRELLDGKGVMGHPGDPAFTWKIEAEELLCQPVLSARWMDGVCHMMTGMPSEALSEKETREVETMMGDHDKEQRLRERLKANYETYIQQLKCKPAPDLIEMASEIAAAKFVYEKLSVEGAFSEYADYLLQFENPLEVVRDGWMSEQSYDHHEELDHALWNMVDKGIGVGDYPMLEEAATGPTFGQGVTMC